MEQTLVIRVMRKKVTLEKGLAMKELITHMSGTQVLKADGTPEAKGPKMETDHMECVRKSRGHCTCSEGFNKERKPGRYRQKGPGSYRARRSREGLWPLRKLRESLRFGAKK